MVKGPSIKSSDVKHSPFYKEKWLRVKGDLTKANPEVTRLLQEFKLRPEAQTGHGEWNICRHAEEVACRVLSDP